MKNSEQNALYNRNERIFFLYRNYLLEGTLNDSAEVIDSNEYNFTKENKDFINEVLDNTDKLEEQITKFTPKDWKWERFNTLEKAVLLNGAAEILLAKNKKAIVIDESIEFARKFCGEKSQPLINGILDKISE